MTHRTWTWTAMGWIGCLLAGAVLAVGCGTGAPTQGLSGPGVTMHRCTNDAHPQNDPPAGSPILLDFYREECPGCKIVGPIMDDLAEEFCGQITLYKIDVDRAPVHLMRNNSIRMLPTVILLDDGREVQRWTEPKDPSVYRAAIRRVLKDEESPAPTGY